MRTSRPVVAIVLAAALAIGLAACSSSSSAADAKTTFTQQANTICRQMKQKGETLSAPVSTATDPAAVPRVLHQMNDLIVATTAQLRALTPPPGDEATVKQAIDALAASGDAAVQVADVPADTADQARVSSVVKLQADTQKASDTAMSAYGLNDCVLG